jgi:Domain of unknown function (DUF4357)
VGEIHETAATLLATLGQPIFEPLTNAAPARGQRAVLLQRLGRRWGGRIHHGGVCSAPGLQSALGQRGIHPAVSRARIRQQLVAEGIMAAQGGVYVFTRNHLFASPSMAAVALMGRSANSWAEWKTPHGQTLDEVKRQAVTIAD